MNNLSNQENYNCRVTTDSGEEFLIYVNWLHNNYMDSWSGWSCQAGAKRLLIDKDLKIYGGECKNDFLGTTDSFDLLDSTICQQKTCTGCTDDLMVEKYDSTQLTFKNDSLWEYKNDSNVVVGEDANGRFHTNK